LSVSSESPCPERRSVNIGGVHVCSPVSGFSALQ
jgi:hypothetical protein